MKVADFAGAGVPVAVYDYAPVLMEVLTTGQQGVAFRDPGELADLFLSVARRQTAVDTPLGKSRTWLSQHPSERWDAHWDSTARPVLVP
jgi:hypothetical protein